MKYPFQIFGSESSKDYDIMFFVNKLGTIDENHSLIKELNKEFNSFIINNNLLIKPVNGNLGVLKDGMLINVFKGTYDECNNSLYYTFKYHHQFHKQHIEKPYNRVDDDYFKHLKLKRCYRFILSFYSRVPELRKDIKEALRSDFKKRYEVLSKINFNYHKEFPNKKEGYEDIYKVIAFQLAQTIGLFFQKEIYTKEDVIKFYPSLKYYIRRMVVNNHDNLNEFLIMLLDIGSKEMIKMESLEEKIFN